VETQLNELTNRAVSTPQQSNLLHWNPHHHQSCDPRKSRHIEKEQKSQSHLEREDDEEEHVGRQIRQERDGDPRPQHGSEPVYIPAGPSVSVEERGRPPLQRGSAGRRGGGRDVEAVHRRHAPRIGRRPERGETES